MHGHVNLIPINAVAETETAENDIADAEVAQNDAEAFVPEETGDAGFDAAEPEMLPTAEDIFAIRRPMKKAAKFLAPKMAEAPMIVPESDAASLRIQGRSLPSRRSRKQR